jgi:serine phosphatase RsbU (regulator of sigma subunit)
LKKWAHIFLFLFFAHSVFADQSDSTAIKDLISRSSQMILKQKDYVNGRKAANEVIARSEGIKFIRGMGDGYLLKAICGMRQNQLDSVRPDLLKAYGYYKLARFNYGIKETFDGISEFYYIQGDAYVGQLYTRIAGMELLYMRTENIFFFSLYMGALLFCFIYNIFLYRFGKDKAYWELAKCIGAYMFFIYNTNYDFATQFDRTMVHLTIMNCLKNYSIMLGTYFFANFLEQLLLDRAEDLSRFYKFVKGYKKALKIWMALCTLQLVAIVLTKYGDPYWYFQHLLLWFAVVDLTGLAFTILIFVMLFVNARRANVRINYLILGVVLNIICMLISASQAVVGTPYSHIPYPAALGSVLFLICMTVAITDKITSYRKEKEEAQANALKHLEGLVAERTRDLKHQKELIEEKQTQIIDSINYAKRLQQAILISEQDLGKHFKEIFVLYKPKDIVSGDFYWFSESESNKILAVADCTGHGVPGAFMCMLGNECLQDVALRKDIETTASALRSLDIKITDTLNKSDRSFRDGMDIALCAFSKDSSTLQFSGANRPLLQVSDGQLIEHKPDKQTIGGNIDRTERNYHTILIDCKPGDTFYLFTDGYADQFGGPKGKKFKYKTLREILFETSKLSLKEQSNIINHKFEEWKGNLEQVDDVCIVGIRV